MLMSLTSDNAPVLGCSDPPPPPEEAHLILLSELQPSGTYYNIGSELTYRSDIDNAYYIFLPPLEELFQLDEEALAEKQEQTQTCLPHGSWTTNWIQAFNPLGSPSDCTAVARQPYNMNLCFPRIVMRRSAPASGQRG